MPIVILNSALVAIRGRVGDVVFKTYRDKIVMTRVPRFTPGAATPAQRARRDRIKAATAFAQRVYASAPAKAFYADEARRLGRQPFRLAISDHLKCADSPVGDETSAEGVRYSAAVRLLDSSASPSPLPPSPVRPPELTRCPAAARGTHSGHEPAAGRFGLVRYPPKRGSPVASITRAKRDRLPVSSWKGGRRRGQGRYRERLACPLVRRVHRRVAQRTNSARTARARSITSRPMQIAMIRPCSG
jgi:hypothetical protein